MGRSSTFYCKTCRVECYLGYGSYRTWLDGMKTVAEFKKADPEDQALHKNQEMLRMLNDHEGHEFETHSTDWAHKHGSVLCGEFGFMGECRPLFDTEGWTDVTSPETTS